jgi:hypothetical protein
MCSTLSHDKIQRKSTSVIPGLHAVISDFIVAILEKRKDNFSPKVPSWQQILIAMCKKAMTF